MKSARMLGTLLLAAWLILTGLGGLIHLSFAYLGTIKAVLALAAGILLILGA